MDPDFTVAKARYAKGMMAVSTPSNGTGFKTRAMRLACALKGRWSGRERCYIMSPSKAAKMRELFDAGRDAWAVSQTIIPLAA